MKAHKSLWFFLLPTVSSCLILSPLRFLFFSFMVNLPSSATISPPLLLLSPPPKPLRPSFPPLLSFTSLPPFSVYPSLSDAFLKKIYPSSPPVLFIALHFLYRHSSACCITPEIHPPPSIPPSPFTFFPDFLWRLKESGDPLSWQRERRWRHSRHDTPASALV